jgi:hypothetical protein
MLISPSGYLAVINDERKTWMAEQETMKGPVGLVKGAMTHAVIRHYEAMTEARRRLLGLMAGQSLATTELLTELVGSSLRTAYAVWSPFLGLPARSATAATAERTAVEDPTDDRWQADETSPGDESENDEDRELHDEADPAVAAMAEVQLMNELSTEQGLGEQPSGQEPTGEEPTGVEVAANGTINVVFRLPSAVDAETVYLCGDFNDWSTTADPMDRLPDGSFELTRALPVGRRWHFRYLLDTDRWENDWAADAYTPNALGDQDSVVDLQTPSASHLVTQN